MQFCCLGSGSKGNATLIRYENTTLMIDCGFSVKYTLARMAEMQCAITDIDAILVTHEHSDHINGVSNIACRFNIPVYATRGTARTGKLDKINGVQWIELDTEFTIGGIIISPVSVPHDACEPCQFIFKAGGKKLGVMTDLGSVSPHVCNAYNNCNALLLEANHDIDMLWAGNYPPSLKHRVASDWGHLSNSQAMQYLQNIDLDILNTLVLGHISEQNNSFELVKKQFSTFEQKIDNVIYATQQQGFSWLIV